MALRKEDGKEFTLAQTLAVTTGYFMSEQGTFGIVYEVLNYMTGDSLYTHALIRAGKEARPYVTEWYPELAYTDEQMESGCDKYGGWKEFMDVLLELHGNSFILWRIPPDDHDVIDPLEELIAMRGGSDENIITVDVPVDDEISPHGDINWKIDDNEDN